MTGRWVGIAVVLKKSRCGAKSYNVTGHLQQRQTLKLHLESATALNTFTGYGEGYVTVNGKRIERSVVVLPDRILADWPARSFDDLAAEHFSMLAGLGREIVLLGTGSRLRFPRAEIVHPLIRAGIGVEVMDLQAACRTYNILVAEQRKVAAALVFA
jgi:uncharacterized protein